MTNQSKTGLMVGESVADRPTASEAGITEDRTSLPAETVQDGAEGQLDPPFSRRIISPPRGLLRHMRILPDWETETRERSSTGAPCHSSFAL